MKTEDLIAQITSALELFDAARQSTPHKDFSGGNQEVIVRAVEAMFATARRLSIPGSTHRETIEYLQKKRDRSFSGFVLVELKGLLLAIKHDLEHGFGRSVTELVHADTFADFLEMASHLLETGYKDAAAVVTGSVIEQHLRVLARKNAIPVELNGKHKKADLINSELTSAAVYSKLDQKSVTTWLGLRNEAAHGNYANYDKAQVALMIQGVEGFLQRYPA